MHIDVVELEHFYSTQLGFLVQRSIRASVRDLWPSVEGDAVLGLGFPNPIMARYGREAARAVIAQPAGQGADWWRPHGRNATALTFEDALPFESHAFNRVVALHLFENTENLSSCLEEIWRVLAPEGRLMAIVPNRRSLWARMDRTPFGHGRPFSRGQISRVLNSSGFHCERQSQALFFPPSKARIMLRIAGTWDKWQSKSPAQTGGVHVIEAVKHVRGITPVKGARVRLRMPVARPALQPV